MKTNVDKEKGEKEVPKVSEDYSEIYINPHKFEPLDIADTVAPQVNATFWKKVTTEDPP